MGSFTQNIAKRIITIIYCRVSSQRQVAEGHGLESQEQTCRNHIKFKGYPDPARVFKDEGVSGGLLNRPGMQELLAFLDEQPNDVEVIVVVDDIKRFARDVQHHFTLKTAIYSRGARLESPTHKFEDSPEGKFVETIFAATAELERNQNKRQVINRMKARLELGFWCFDNPPGYKYTNDALRGKILVKDEPKATIIKDALEGFASGRLPTQVDVQRFLQSKGFYHRKPTKHVHLEQTKRLLTRALLYAGYIEYPHWQISRRKGHHEAIISFTTFEKINERLSGKAKSYIRKDANPDFPLRGFVVCAGCHRLYTASWSRGNGGRIPYYRCQTKECAYRNKSIPRKDIEGEFELILKDAKPHTETLNLARAVVLDLWNQKIKDVVARNQTIQQEMKQLDKDVNGYVERIAETTQARVIKAYEKKIEELENKRIGIQENLNNAQLVNFNFETAVDVVFKFIEKPSVEWERRIFRRQQMVLKLVFTRPLTYEKGRGYGTTDFSLPFALFRQKVADNSQLVDMGGIEPPCRM